MSKRPHARISSACTGDAGGGAVGVVCGGAPLKKIFSSMPPLGMDVPTAIDVIKTSKDKDAVEDALKELTRHACSWRGHVDGAVAAVSTCVINWPVDSTVAYVALLALHHMYVRAASV